MNITTKERLTDIEDRLVAEGEGEGWAGILGFTDTNQHSQNG